MAMCGINTCTVDVYCSVFDSSILTKHHQNDHISIQNRHVARQPCAREPRVLIGWIIGKNQSEGVLLKGPWCCFCLEMATKAGVPKWLSDSKDYISTTKVGDIIGHVTRNTHKYMAISSHNTPLCSAAVVWCATSASLKSAPPPR